MKTIALLIIMVISLVGCVTAPAMSDNDRYGAPFELDYGKPFNPKVSVVALFKSFEVNEDQSFDPDDEFDSRNEGY